MKAKKITMLMIGILLISCKHASSRPSISTSNNQPKELQYDASLPEVIEDGYEFKEKRFEEYPTNLTETSELNFELSEDGTYYRVNGKNTFYGNKLVIPAYHNNLPVKEIMNDGFAYKEWLSEIYIPETIEKFDNGAFSSAPRLTKIYYNARNAEDLAGKNWIFYPKDGSTNKIEVYIGPDVERIPNRLFFPLSTDPSKVPTIGKIHFAKESKIKTIGEYAFYKSKEAELDDLPDTIEEIGDYAFYEGKTENLNLSKSLKSIGEYAFAFNKRLKHIKFNENLEEIKGHAFYNCSELVKSDMSMTKIEVIGESAYRKCERLANVELPNTVKEIEDRVFEASGLEVFDAPKSLEIIRENAFKGCSKLKGIRLNEGLKEIEKGTFKDAINVTKLVVEAKNLKDFGNGNNIFAKLGQNTDGVEVIFMETVTEIPSHMFFPNANEEEEPKLKRIVLLKTIKSIKDYAFYELNVEKIDYEGSIEEFQKVIKYNNEFTNIEYFNN